MWGEFMEFITIEPRSAEDSTNKEGEIILEAEEKGCKR